MIRIQEVQTCSEVLAYVESHLNDKWGERLVRMFINLAKVSIAVRENDTSI